MFVLFLHNTTDWHSRHIATRIKTNNDPSSKMCEQLTMDVEDERKLKWNLLVGENMWTSHFIPEHPRKARMKSPGVLWKEEPEGWMGLKLEAWAVSLCGQVHRGSCCRLPAFSSPSRQCEHRDTSCN